MQPLRLHIDRCSGRGQLCPRESKLRDSRTWPSALRFMKAHFRPWFARCLAGCVAGMALHASAQPEVYGNPSSSAFIPIPKDADDWTRHFHIGALVGMNISANFNMNGSAFPISGNDPSHGIFDNGYVRPDQNGDPAYTSYWGYNSISQYNSPAQTLTMNATTAFSTSGSANAGGGLFPGFEMAYGDNLWYWKHARVGWETGFGLLPINISENSSLSATVTQETYTFRTDTLGPVGFPTAGSYQGGPGGTGPIIPTAFTAITNSTGGNVIGSHTLDVMLYTVRLGPSFYWDLTDHLGMSLGAGPAIGIVSGNYKYNEIITAGNVSAHNQGQIDGTKLVYGGYANAALMYHVTDNGDIFVGAQYMPMSDATISGGGREGRLNLGGQLYFSVGISWPF